MDPSEANAVLYISILAFVSCFLAVLGIAGVMDMARGRRDLRARVVGTLNPDGGVVRPEDQSGLGYFRELFYGLLKKLGEANQGKEKNPQGSALAQRLMSAGFRREAAPAMFAGVKVILLVLIPLILFLLPIKALDEGPIVQTLLAYLGAAGVGLYGPELWLQHVADKRKTKIINGFPDALDLLVVCIEAGLGLDAAIFR